MTHFNEMPDRDPRRLVIVNAHAICLYVVGPPTQIDKRLVCPHKSECAGRRPVYGAWNHDRTPNAWIPGHREQARVLACQTVLGLARDENKPAAPCSTLNPVNNIRV